MRTLGALVFAAHLMFLLAGALLLGASFAGFTGGTYMVVSAVLAILLWGGFAAFTVRGVMHASAVIRGSSDRVDACLRWAHWLFFTLTILAPATGLGLGFLAFASCGPLWLSGLYHWLGLACTVLAFTAFFFLPLVVRWCIGAHGDASTPHRFWVPLVTAGPVALLWGLTWLIAYSILSGDVDEKAYPDPKASPYKLPFPRGETSWVIQGNNSGLNHTGNQKHAWDFRRRCGTAVLAARGGTVSKVVHSNDGNGSGAPNNMVEVDHGDGTTGRYLHVQKDSAKVKKGDAVKQGSELAKVGNVGNSLTGHVHFVVEKGGKSIEVSFADVTVDDGIPRAFKTYKSGN